MVVEAGFTETEAPVKPPGFQVYATAELVAVKVEDPPGQIAVGLATAVIVGNGFTTKLNVEVEVQPAKLPVTV